MGSTHTIPYIPAAKKINKKSNPVIVRFCHLHPSPSIQPHSSLSLLSTHTAPKKHFCKNSFFFTVRDLVINTHTHNTLTPLTTLIFRRFDQCGSFCYELF